MILRLTHFLLSAPLAVVSADLGWANQVTGSGDRELGRSTDLSLAKRKGQGQLHGGRVWSIEEQRRRET
jgi:hypothetical protein